MCKQSLRSSDDGMTVLELMVASFIALLLMAMTFGSLMSGRRLYELDVARTRLTQNVRGALDLIGMDVRQAGERLPESFTVVEIIDGGEGPDELVLRRNLLDEVLVVCGDLASGSSPGTILLSDDDAGAVPACIYGAQSERLAAWADRRAEEGGIIRAYLFNLATREGEFIDYTGESDTGTTLGVERTPAALAHDYPAANSALYLLVEWRYRLDTAGPNPDVLQVIENGDFSQPQNVTFGIQNLQLRAVLVDDTVLDEFGMADDWSMLKGIEVVISGQERIRTTEVTAELSSRFFVRNILSL